MDPQIRQRAALQEARAVQDIEAFTQGQAAEAEAESFASAAEAGEAAAVAEGGGTRHGQRPEPPQQRRGHPDLERHAGVGSAAALQPAPAAAEARDQDRLGQRLCSEGPAGAEGARQGGAAAAAAFRTQSGAPATAAGPVQRQRGLQDQPAEPRAAGR